jgi:hypothetical protein
MTKTYLVTDFQDDQHLLQKLSHDPSVVVWQAVEDGQLRAYVEDVDCQSAHATELQLIHSREGASSSERGDYHYIVETDVSAESDEEFNAWYDTEHLPGLARVPGTVSAKRYLRLSGAPRYIACYELLSPAVMESEAWLAIRHTAWSSRVRPMFFNTVRRLFQRRDATIA